MSLDVINFLRDEFLHKYEKLKNSRSSIDAPLRKIFRDYEALLNGIEDIASLQGADKDLLYNLNCAVDDCLVESAESPYSIAKRNFRRCKQRGVSLGHRKNLEENLTKLKAIISSQCGSSVRAPHKPASIPLLNYVVHGFQNQFDEIVKKISISSEEGSSQPNMRAVGIVGIGGSGKTTLASMVFNSREVREKYHIMIWASLTSTLNKKESTIGSVFREILVGAQNNNNLKTMLQKVEGGLKRAADHTLDKHIEHFKVTLKRNSGKYLIVLDDVWETEYWFAEKEEGSEGKCILSREWIEKTGGTVVVTSRLEEMAENIVGKKNLYMMLPVEKEPCFEIFLDRATKDGHFSREDVQLRNLKKDIEDRCYGLPLAACTVADIIVAKRKEEEAKKEMDAAKAKAEAEAAEAEASASKAEAGGEADGSKVKAETEGEAGGSKAETEAEGDTAAAKMEDAAALKAESEREADALKGKTKIEGETETEGEAGGSKAEAEAEGETAAAKMKAAAASKAEGEADALEAKIEEAKGKAVADVLKAETEGDVSKAQAEAVLSGEGTHGELDARLEKEQK